MSNSNGRVLLKIKETRAFYGRKFKKEQKNISRPKGHNLPKFLYAFLLKHIKNRFDLKTT